MGKESALPRAVIRGPGTVEISEDRLVQVRPLRKGLGDTLVDGPVYIAIWGTGDFKERAFYLDMYYDWVLALDADGSTILIPLKKEGE